MQLEYIIKWIIVEQLSGLVFKKIHNIKVSNQFIQEKRWNINYDEIKPRN